MGMPMRKMSDTAISFVVETIAVRDGRKLGRAKTDSDGYYPGFPLAVLGVVSDNKTMYDTPSFIQQMTGDDSHFRMMIEDGKLFGEYGHPDLTGMSQDDAMARLVRVDEQKVSHHIRGVRNGDTVGGGTLLVGDIKPHGPYAQYLQDSLMEPHINTAFSLRGLSSQQVRAGVKHRSLKKLVTFDYVAAGGFNQAAKRYAALESLEVDKSGFSWTVRVANDVVIMDEVSLECFTDSELNEIFGSRKIVKGSSRKILLQGDTITELTKRGSPDALRSFYQDVMTS